jgi:hypothetical protein
MFGNLFAFPPVAYLFPVDSGVGPCETRACAVSPSVCLADTAPGCGPIVTLGSPPYHWAVVIGAQVSYATSVDDPSGGGSWTHPITTYLHPQASGEICTCNQECASRACCNGNDCAPAGTCL